MRGRFAPSPTGRLHLGNIRTASLAGLSAWSVGGELIIRMEDLDPFTSSVAHADQQLADLAVLGIESAVSVVFQSHRFELYRDAIATLERQGLVYRCYCTRREIRDAAAAPHGEVTADGAYPGTCRELSIERRSALEREGRRSALRLRTDGERYEIVDRLAGPFVGVVDDVVLQRNDGVPAYNLAVVVDDHLQGVTEVVRGDDLLSSTPRQRHLQLLLGFATPTYAHVPLVVGPDGERLAKRHGAVTLPDLLDRGFTVGAVIGLIGESLGLCSRDESVTLAELVERFSIDKVPRSPWVWAG